MVTEYRKENLCIDFYEHFIEEPLASDLFKLLDDNVEWIKRTSRHNQNYCDADYTLNIRGNRIERHSLP
jgi:hypothetical protein